MKSKQNILIDNLNEFIGKYYQFKIVKGFAILVILSLIMFFFMSAFEYNLYLSVFVKTTLIYALSAVLVAVFILLVVFPSLCYLNIRKRITYREAVLMISNYFPKLDDRLINAYELSQKESESFEDDSLLIASINQRISTFSMFSFTDSISFKKIYEYLKYLVLIFIFAVGIYFLVPDFYSSGSNRIIHFRTDFKAPADFYYYVDSELIGEKGEHFNLNIHTEGDYFPKSVYLVFGGTKVSHDF